MPMRQRLLPGGRSTLSDVPTFAGSGCLGPATLRLMDGHNG
jgi:hypothetical protein